MFSACKIYSTIITFAALLLLIALVGQCHSNVSGSLYKAEYLEDIPDDHIQVSTIEQNYCAIRCAISGNCIVFMFDGKENSCYLFGCVNPHITATSDESHQIYADTMLKVNTMLARGTNVYRT